jgi:hypothetical protein
VITSISAHNWQSLRSVDLRLGRFTVIVGPSNSGKSAVVRALRAVASNVRGGGHITRGARSAAVAVTTSTGHTVTLERSATSGSYRVVNPDGTEDTYTSLAGAVPEAVTKALGIAPIPAGGVSINVAGQLDPPYLLADTGATVARELGELTNVTTIFGAVREGARRRTALATLLKTREADLSTVTSAAHAFAGLPGKLTGCAGAEQALQRAEAAAGRVTRLRSATQSLVVAEQVLARTAVPDVPVFDGVLAAQTRLARFRSVVTAATTAHNALAAATTAVDQSTANEAALHQQLHDALLALGTCPTCRQPITR